MKIKLKVTGLMVLLTTFSALPTFSDDIAADVVQARRHLETLKISALTNGHGSVIARNSFALWSDLAAAHGVFSNGVRLLTPSASIPMGVFTNSAVAVRNGPPWWYRLGVIASHNADDYAIAVQGQVKWLAKQASLALTKDFQSIGGINQDIINLVNSFSLQNNGLPVTVGQLKNTVYPFWSQLSDLGVYEMPSWMNQPGMDNQALVTVGQLKTSFAFNGIRDSDGDGMPDYWESAYGLDPQNPSDAESDSDLDGIANSHEFLNGTSPVSADSDEDGVSDYDENNRYAKIFDVAGSAGVQIVSPLHSLSPVKDICATRFSRTILFSDGIAVHRQTTFRDMILTNVVMICGNADQTLFVDKNGGCIGIVYLTGSDMYWYQGSFGRLPMKLASGWFHGIACFEDGAVAHVGAYADASGNLDVDTPGTPSALDQTIIRANFSTLGQYVEFTNPILNPVPDAPLFTVDVAAGLYMASARGWDGRIKVWGRPYQNILSVPDGLSNVVKTAHGIYHSAALLTNGTVSVWGRNTYEQLNIPAGLSNVVDLVCSDYATIARLNNGRLTVWGYNYRNMVSAAPTGSLDIASVGASGDSAWALTRSGQCIGWGDHSFRITNQTDRVMSAGFSTSGPRGLALFAPRHDSDGDGIEDYLEINFLGTDPLNRDSDWDGLSDFEEVYTYGTKPLDSDSDADGFKDATDPAPLDPLVPSWSDQNNDGIPDAWAQYWFGAGFPGADCDSNTNGFSNLASLLCGLNPLTPATPGFVVNGSSASQNVVAYEISPTPFDFNVPTNELGLARLTNIVIRSFPVKRTSAWQQFFISSSPTKPKGWSQTGCALFWGDSEQTATNSIAPATDDSVRIPLPDDLTCDQLVLRIAIDGSPSQLSAPLYLLKWAPQISILESSRILTGNSGTKYFFVEKNENETFEAPISISYENRPQKAPASAAELQAYTGLVNAEAPDVTIIQDPLRIVSPVPCAVTLPFGGSGTNVRLFFWDLQISRGSARTGPRLSQFDQPYPLNTASQRAAFRNASKDTSSWESFKVSLGFSSSDVSIQIHSGTGHPQPMMMMATSSSSGGASNEPPAHVCVYVDGVLVDPCTDIEKDTDTDSPDSHDNEDDDDDDCDDCVSCDGGSSLGSVQFRESLGQPGIAQSSGFIWFHLTEPTVITPNTFNVLGMAGVYTYTNSSGYLAAVTNTMNMGRSMRVLPIENGVKILVWNATGIYEHSWEIFNEGGSPSHIRIRQISRISNTMQDVTFVCSDGNWSRHDTISGLLESRLSSYDAVMPAFKTTERIIRSTGATAVEDYTAHFGCIGEGDRAVRREQSASGFDEQGAFSRTSRWLSDSSNIYRNGKLLLRGDSRNPWEYRALDGYGRQTFRAVQLDGSPFPQVLSTAEDGNLPQTTQDFAALGFDATITVYSYEPVSEDDSLNYNESLTPRQITTYVSQTGALIRVSQEHHVYVRDSDLNGLPLVTERTIRMNNLETEQIVSSVTSYPNDDAVQPVSLRGLPVHMEADDGSVTEYQYEFGSYNAATYVFTAAETEATHLRVASTTTFDHAGARPAEVLHEIEIRDLDFGRTLLRQRYVPALQKVFDTEAFHYDEKGRLRATTRIDGENIVSLSTNAYSCCRLLWQQDGDGIRTLRSATTGRDKLYYATEEPSLSDLTSNGQYRVTCRWFDALGRETNMTVGAAATLPGAFTNGIPAGVSLADCQITRTLYPSGTSDHVVRISPSGICTETYSEKTQVQECTVTLTSQPGGVLVSSNVVTQLRNGSAVTLNTWTNGWRREERSITWTGDGVREERTTVEASDCSAPVVMSLRRYDSLGRLLSETTPAGTQTYSYMPGSTRIAAVTHTDAQGSRVTSSVYDASGVQVGSIIQAGQLPVKQSLTVSAYGVQNNALIRTTTSLDLENTATNQIQVVGEQLSGLSATLRQRTVSSSHEGYVTTSETVFDPLSFISTSTDQTDSFPPTIRKNRFGYPIESASEDERTLYAYDGLGRVRSTATLRTDTNLVLSSSSILYDAVGNAVSNSVVYGEDVTLNTASYDVFGRPLVKTDALGYSVTNQYAYDGRLTSVEGAAYPVAYAYDTAGRMTNMVTRRHGLDFQPVESDATRWTYNYATGFLTNKTHANGGSVAYAYTSSGLPTITRWARGATRTHWYDLLGRITWTAYSDAATPAIQYVYGSGSRLHEVYEGETFLWQYGHSDKGAVTNETLAGESGLVHALSVEVDARQRPLATALFTTNGVYAAKWRTYDASGRLSALAFTNFFGRGCGLDYMHDGRYCTGYRIIAPTGGVFRRTVVRDPYRRNLIRSAAHTWDDQALGQRTYAYDPLGRATRMWTDAQVTNAYTYNVRSEVIGAALGTNTYAYYYDDIGNRDLLTRNDEEGRYTSFISGNRPDFAVDFTYPDNPLDYLSWTNMVESGYDSDVDGNLTYNGRGPLQNHAYDCENRLIRSWGTNGAVTYTYDYRHRRTSKIVRDGADNALRSHTYAYDGWNLILERIAYAGGATDEIEYFWGSDLSGSEQGAGGVGGLVALSINGAFYFPCYDNNGNIIAYADESGSLAAQFAYDAFGNPFGTENSELATLLSFRFSTKYLDPETGFYYYGYRYYDPDLGRWLTRDPIEEQGGLNLYGFCGNDGVNKWDKLGNIYNPFTHCCRQGRIIPRKPIDTGVKICKQYNRRIFGQERSWLLQHAWIEIGKTAIGFDDLAGVNFRDGYYGSKTASCTPIMLSPCLYDIDSFKEAIIQTASSFQFPYHPIIHNCWVWVYETIEVAKIKSLW